MDRVRHRVHRCACLAGFFLLFGWSASARAAADNRLDWASPAVDGIVSWGEWDLSHRLEFGGGFVAMRSDAKRLYVLVDVREAGEDDPASTVWLTFDVDRDRQISRGIDINYAFVPATGEIRYQYYTGPGERSAFLPETRSSLARGFGSFVADDSAMVDPSTLRVTRSPHRVWEMAIDLDEIGASPGELVRFGIRVVPVGGAAGWEVPGGFDHDFMELAEATLTVPFEKVPEGDPKATIGLQADPIEITQAIQTRKNTLPLVQGKKTVARVYVDVKGVNASQPVTIFLYAKQNGVDLPGSPIAKIFMVPPFADRERLDDVPYVLLPSWWTEGNVSFTAKVKDSFGKEVTSAPVAVEFKKRRAPLVWVVPVNTGSAAAPQLPSNAEIAAEESDMRAMYPVPDVTFVRKDWKLLGTVQSHLVTWNYGFGALDKVKELHGKMVVAWLLGMLIIGEPPFTLPDQIYAAASKGGGLSDPTWYGGGSGYAAIGHRAPDGSAVMPHEINHNLDRSSAGTWGRHTPNGCGASGPDPNWPYGTCEIQEVGFDTRPPASASGARLTVVPHDYPDFMSYCASGTSSSVQLPATWISPYRWKNLFDRFPPSSSSKGMPESMDEIGTVFYIAGRVRDDGTGKLDPLLVLPGIPDEPAGREGEYAIEIRDAEGGLLRAIPIPVSFLNPDGRPIDTYYFRFQTPEVRGAASVALLRGRQVLDAVFVSSNAPEVSLISPNGGERWSGVHPVIWEAGDADRDPLRFDVYYTPDGGRRWIPVASGIEGDSIEVDSTILPGGSGARIRVIATDGFHTVQDESDETFWVASKPPQVIILGSDGGAGFRSGEPAAFRAATSDLEDGDLPEDAFIWMSEGTVFGIGREVEAILPGG
ncbi:MAG: hypothetical protein JXP34_26840, partial [Planctomycetes bacterium]|nr:hypothetical protein [Planctomycetota bacterium]